MSPPPLPPFRRKVLLVLLSAFFCVSCERTATDTPVPEENETRTESAILETGGAAAKTLMETLGSQLKSSMEGGGPVAAVEVCRQIALPLTEAVGGDFEGIVIRRTTLKPRNPANAPDDTDRAVLEAMAAQTPPEIVTRRVGNTTRYYQPIAIQEVCLKCHGDPSTFPKPLVDLLKTSYPEDAATGYSLGDFRGAIRVDFAGSR